MTNDGHSVATRPLRLFASAVRCREMNSRSCFRRPTMMKECHSRGPRRSAETPGRDPRC
jgi:hypothetical protein